jgi:phage terminase small subunit
MPRTVRKDANLKPGKPLKPSNLSDRAAAEWDRLVGELENAQIATSSAHRALISVAATLAADIATQWETLKKEGELLRNTKTGAVQSHPATKRLDALRRDYIKVLTALGTRATPAPPPDNGPTLEEILAG